jgi:hypothetical protein
MYTSRSESFSKEFKEKALVAIGIQIQKFTGYSEELFVKTCGERHGNFFGMDQVKTHGHRWKDSEQVYQAMIMCLERRVIEKRGPGMMTEGEAKALELMFMLPTTGYMVDVLAAEAVRSAADCDHWYMFEKQWD